MKKALLLVTLGLVAVPFSVSASTIYQQLTDSASAVNLDKTCSAQTVLATFQVVENTVLSSSAFFYGVFTNQDLNVAAPIIQISSSTSPTSPLYVFGDGTSPEVPVGDSDNFLEVPYQSGSVVLLPDNTYDVVGCGIKSGGGTLTTALQVRSNLSSDFVFGYITDDGSSSIPVAPGIPGFTDYGISTTSQQAYCNQNFSTSTGLLDSIGASISLGFCNVGVFLFVPSTSVLSQWQNLASTSQVKIPFSYIYQTVSQFRALSATTTENVPTYQSNLHDSGLGSTTAIGNILPNLDWLSKSTIDTFLPSGVHTALFLLARSAIWFVAFMMIYRRIIPKQAKI